MLKVYFLNILMLNIYYLILNIIVEIRCVIVFSFLTDTINPIYVKTIKQDLFVTNLRCQYIFFTKINYYW